MAEKHLQATVDLFRTYLLDQGWSVLKEKDIQSGLQLLVTDGITNVPINCYTNGNALIQGPAGALRTELQTWWKQQRSEQAPPTLWDVAK